MGLNMPARTVFHAVKKFDGSEEHIITPGTQMSGRAGRRGKDDRACIVMTDEKMEESAMREMLQNKPRH